jgi:hypothetical protein
MHDDRLVTAQAAARERRERAAAEFRPERVRTLLVAEAPPSALDRYFYFLDVSVHDSLFRYVVEATFGERPSRDKLPWLDALRDAGYYLVDLSPDPFKDPAVLPPLLPGLVRRCEQLRPDRIVVIGARLYDLAHGELRDAGLPVAGVRLPFPGSGQQRRFLERARPVLGITSRAPSRSDRS